MNNIVDIIIPTYNNREYLYPCLRSILDAQPAHGLVHIYVINNGHKDSCNYVNDKRITVINTGDNLGWEGGLKEGLKHSTAPFVMFLNDDVRIPLSSHLWLNTLLNNFRNPLVGAVGPSTNVVMGMQNIFNDHTQFQVSVNYLIGYCMLIRREALDKAGGVDASLSGGDDIDLSIRLRDAGYTLVADKSVFIYHHGFKTGTRIHGDYTKRTGWNSARSTERTNTGLIKKHGFRKWYDTMYTLPENKQAIVSLDDIEGDIIRKHIKGSVVLDLGSGGNKTIPTAIGIDMIPKGKEIDTLKGIISTADIEGDVSGDLPVKTNSADTIIARHIVEHLIDPIGSLIAWKKSLAKDGRLIIAVPDHDKFNTIPLNPEHVHGFTMISLKRMLEASGYMVLNQLDSGNGVSFITIAET